MVAKISMGKSIIGLINYNENKVAKGDARLIAAQNMVLGKKESELSYDMKVGTFEQILNRKKHRKLDKSTFHVSLNFDPAEKMNDEVLREIAGKYMEGMGYRNQPFLVYRHEDTLHPHIHIVSIKVDREGRKVDDLFYKRRSEKVRKDLEVEYNLVKASNKINQAMNHVEPLVISLDAKKGETKKAITNIVSSLLNNYKMTSLQEFQTLLNHYNVNLEHIKGTSKEKPYEGLVYYLIDDKGNRAGAGIKASSIYSRPTLQNLEIQFAKNIEHNNNLRKKTATEIEKLIRRYSTITKEDFTKQLAERGITALYHRGKKSLYEITYIDHIRKTIFKGSDLGKAYSWKALEKRFAAFSLPIDQQTKIDEKQTVPKSSGNYPNTEKELLRAASSALVHIYNQQRKSKDNGEYLESAFIRKLHQIDLANPLIKKLPLIDHTQSKILAEKFKAYKLSQLQQIEVKERTDFEKHVEKAFSIIRQISHLNPEDSLTFLYRFGINIAKENATFVAKPVKGEYLKIPLGKDNLQFLLIDKHTLPTIDKKNITAFTNGQRAFIDKALMTHLNIQDTPNKFVILRETNQEPFINKEKGVANKATLADILQVKDKEMDGESNSPKKKEKRKMKIS